VSALPWQRAFWWQLASAFVSRLSAQPRQAAQAAEAPATALPAVGTRGVRALAISYAWVPPIGQNLTADVDEKGHKNHDKDVTFITL
jgi:hypothetical protein